MGDKIVEQSKRSFKFKKKERITSPDDFKNVMRKGRRLSSKNFLIFLKHNNFQFHRLGIVVKKDVGSATYRNRIKRYFREFFRLHKHQIKGSLDIIILIKRGCSINHYEEALEELKGLIFL